MIKKRLIQSHTVFISTLVVAGMICLLVFFVGLKDHETLYHNAIHSTGIIAAVFFGFVFTGLYKGWKMKDTLGYLPRHFSKLKRPEIPDSSGLSFDLPGGFEIADDPVGCLATIVLVIGVVFFGGFLLWVLGIFFWGLILVLAGMFYWIIFRAYRFIFRHVECRKNFWKSFRYALGYSACYTGLVYAIIFTAHFIALKLQ